VLRSPEEGPQGQIARGILRKGGGLDEQCPVLVYEGDTWVSAAMSIPAKRIGLLSDGGMREPRGRCPCSCLCMRGRARRLGIPSEP
ncbi:MAG TPA: hypothetical protein VJM10_07435, partial [Candidatus Methylomirabilis sp.]|nr:hypothetical protein [Candidatus Methylomirabilis sp.]